MQLHLQKQTTRIRRS